jgi:TonB-linked SusC/RagA family outer membrane protein
MKKKCCSTGVLFKIIFSSKIFKIMRNTFLLILISIFQANAIDSYSQNTRLTLNLDKVTVANVLEEIENNSEFFFLFNSKLIDVEREVSISVEDEKISDILNSLFSGTGINYRVYDRQIILSPSEEIVMPSSLQQGKKITGTVTDSKGEPIIGANVIVSFTTIGAITDISGKYSIDVPQEAKSLTFSFIGMQPQEVSIGTSAVINVVLEEAVTGLDEVVVVGYGTKIKRSVTGAVSTVASAEIQSFAASNNVVDALQSSISGAFVVAQSGRPGEASNIYLRGPVSVNGGNPLYVVDGIPQANLGFNFNMADIESVSVLKDASAAAIYGAKAAGGVILVTTKRGVKGKLKISFNSSYGVRNVYALADQMNRDEYIQAKLKYGIDVVSMLGPEDTWSSLPDIDWQKAVTHTGSEQNYGISLTGGGDVSTFFISGNYNKVEGVALGNWISRYTLRINTDHNITKKLKFKQGLYFKNGLEVNGGTSQTFRRTPAMAVYDPLAISNRGYARVIKGFQGNNTVQTLMDNYEREKDYSLELNGTLSYNIIDGLNFSVFGGTTMANGESYNYTYEIDDAARVNPPTIAVGQSKSQNYIVTYTLNYDKTFDKHHITALAGYEARKSDLASVNYGNQTTLLPEPQSSLLMFSTLTATGAYNRADVYDRILSQFGRLEYTYANKYLLTANIRRDGYGSKFGPENKYGIFPGISAGWVLSEESFLKKIPFINMLKFRAGYGLLGNAVGTDFAYTSWYQTGYSQDWSATNTNQKATGVMLASQLANPNIQWENVATTNIGLDGVLFKSKLSFNIDYYSRQTKEMLYNVPIALSAGVGTNVQANVGQMSNKGMEMFFEYRTNFGKFNFNIGLNGGFNKNLLISLDPSLDKLFIASGFISGESGNGIYGTVSPSRSEPGLPLGQFYGYQTAGIYSTDIASGEVRPKVGNYTPVAGDLIYVDQNSDGVMNTKDLVYIGNPWPKFTYGITIGGDWKKMIDIKASFNGVYGNDIYNAYESYAHVFYSDYTSTMDIYESSFFGDNQLTSVPRVGTLQKPDNNKNWGLMSDYHVQKGSYIMLKNLQIGFTLPRKTLSSLGVSKVRAVFTGENLFTLTHYKGLSPIIPPYQRSILAQGVDIPTGRYPFSKLYAVGLNIEF